MLFVLPIRIFGHVKVLLTYIVRFVVLDWIPFGISQAVPRENHDGSIHPRDNVPWEHGSARSTVVDKCAGLDRLESQDNFLPGSYMGKLCTTQSSCRRMKVNIVQQCVRFWIHKSQLDIVILMHYDDRPGNAAVKGHRPDCCTIRAYLHELLFNHHTHLYNLRWTYRNLLMRRQERWRDKSLSDPFQFIAL